MNQGSARGPSALKETNVIRDQENPGTSAIPLCRKCRQPIEPPSDDDSLDKFGNFIRLRCAAPECGHEDWYKDVHVSVEKRSPVTEMQPGEVWVHDVILGLSFRAGTTPPPGSFLDAPDVHL